MAEALPPVVCIIGNKKSGKTTTVVGLVHELVQRGHRVMTAKHGHHFKLDKPGSDSYRHRHDAGAERVAIAGPDQVAVMGSWPDGHERPLQDLVRDYLCDAEIVVAEGFKTAPFPKIEVFRSSAHPEPLYGCDAAANGKYLAILADNAGPLAPGVPVMDINAPNRFALLADLLVTEFKLD